jgi:hypothetical protein
MDEQWSVDGPRVIDIGGTGDPVRAVKVRLVAGRVDVVAHDRGDGGATAEVTSVRGRPLEVSWDGGTLEVAHPRLGWESLFEHRAGWPGRDDEAVVSIAVPRGAEIELGTVSGDGLVSGIHAPARVRTVSGTVVVDGVVGKVSARTVSGEIEVRDQDGEFSGESVSGAVSVHATNLPSLSSNSVSGDVSVDLLGSPSELRVQTVSGDVTLRFPAGAGYDVRARSVSGAVVADGRRLDSHHGPVKGRLSAGDPDVRLVANTVSGDVTLLRAPA